MAEKLYRIGDAAELLGLKTYVLRYWESEFSQLRPVRTGKGQRRYTETDVALLGRIRYLLHEQGLTIEGARRILKGASALSLVEETPAAATEATPAAAAAPAPRLEPAPETPPDALQSVPSPRASGMVQAAARDAAAAVREDASPKPSAQDGKGKLVQLSLDACFVASRQEGPAPCSHAADGPVRHAPGGTPDATSCDGKARQTLRQIADELRSLRQLLRQP